MDPFGQACSKASHHSSADSESPQSTWPSRTSSRTRSTGTHSTRSDSPGSLGSPTCRAPSAANS